MEYRLRNDLMRRKDERVQFYYKSIGLVIKKRRVELDLTQESLAKGICSNTYISKIENNQIEVNKESLLLIMEKMSLTEDKISFPEEMVIYLEKGLEYYFYKDIEKYQELFHDIEKYEVGILIQIVRMGYYILTEDFNKARYIHDDLYMYLNSLEDFGFASFLLFSCLYNIGIGDLKRAKVIIESFDKAKQKNEIILGIYNYAKFLTYGQLHIFNKSRDALNQALHIYFNHDGIKRINDLLIWKNIFAIYEGEKPRKSYLNYNLRLLLPSERNYFLIVHLTGNENPEKILSMFDKSNWLYQVGCYLVAKYYLDKNNIEKYEFYLDEVKNNNYKQCNHIDFYNMLKLHEQNEEMQLKDLLINQCLPYAYKIQNIFFMNNITNIITEILAKNKRYKDSLTYFNKNKRRIEAIQNHTI